MSVALDDAVAKAIRCACLAVLVVAGSVPGCGGGGGAGTGDTGTFRKPLEALSRDTLPAGDRIDVSGDDFFAFAAGDRALYLGTPVVNGPTVQIQRAVTEGPDALGNVTIVENVPGRADLESTTERWLRRPEGWATQGATGGTLPPGVTAALNGLLMYPLPFYPAGSERVVVRQGPTGQDLDGDGRDESFRFEFRQIFVGFEQGERGGRPERRARFLNQAVLTLQPSSPQFLVTTTELEEEVVFASHTGMISARRVRRGIGAPPLPYDGPTFLQSGTLAGHDVGAAWNAGSARYLAMQHRDLAYDPVHRVYYAALMATDAGHPGTVARIDPFTGDATYSEPFGGDVTSIALSADGSTLYAAVFGRPEILRLSLPDLAVVQRLPLPDGNFAFSLSVSPRDPGVLAYVSASRMGLWRGGVLQPGELLWPDFAAGTTTAPTLFAPDGATLFAFDQFKGLVRIAVTDTGVTGPSTRLDGSAFGQTLSLSPAGLVAGHALFDLQSFRSLGTAPDGSDLTDCVSLPGGARWVCKDIRGVRVGLLDATRLAPLPDGRVPFPGLPPGVGRGGLVRLVPGPPGQVAAMLGGSNFWHGDHLALFNNPDFR